MNTCVIRLFCALILTLVFPGTAVVAADPPQLILQSGSEEVAIKLDQAFPVLIDAVTGDIRVTPLEIQSCSSDRLACEDVGVTIASFTLSSSSVTRGGKILANWESRGGWECGGWGLPGSNWNTSGFPRLPRGSLSISTSGVVPASYNVKLLCRNGSATAETVRSLTVIEPVADSPDTCADRLPPAGMLVEPKPKLVHVSGGFFDRRSAVTWYEMYGEAFPRGNNGFVGIDPHRYMTLSFNTGALGKKGEIVFSELQNPFARTFKIGSPVVTISECPGDFGPQPNARCHRSSVTNFRWARNDVAGTFDCPLGDDTDLFFNVTYGKSGTIHDDKKEPNPNLQWGCGTYADTESCGSNTLPTYIN